MIKGSILFLISFIASVNGQSYCAGEQVSIAHQNISHEVCAGFEDYQVGDEFKLADYNGDLNGGNYHVTLIDMSASW